MGGIPMGGFSGVPGRSPIWGYPDGGGFSGDPGRSPIWGYPDGGL